MHSEQTMPMQSSSNIRRKILVVDDDPIVIKTLSFKLQSAGFEVIGALDGSEAVAAARTERPDLILLDLGFPPDVGFGGGMTWDGLGIMTWMRHLDELKHTPVIVITSSDPAALGRKCMDAGAVGYFRKPLDYQELIQAIHGVLNGPDAAPSPEPESPAA